MTLSEVATAIVAGTSMGGGRPVRSRPLVHGLSKVFELNPSGLNWPRAVMFLDVALVPVVAVWAAGHPEYVLSAVFGALLAGLIDPGGAYGYRVVRVGGFALVGAAVTALGFGLSGTAWGWLVLASFAVTLVAGLAVIFGAHRFVAAVLLNVWFIVALSLGVTLHRHSDITNYTWAQVLAWTGGSALWIAVTFVAWLIGGRRDKRPVVPEFPGDTSARPLTRPLAVFAVLRALAMAGSIAIAFGLDLSHAAWLPIAAIIAMKPSFEQTTLVAAQRVVGALIGAAVAGLLLLVPANEHGLRLFSIQRGMEVVALVLFMHAVAVRFWNYAIYSGAIAAGVLILLDLPQPSDYSAEGDRVLWTIAGVGIAVLVTLPAGLLARRKDSR
jgi:hypothetical protein